MLVLINDFLHLSQTRMPISNVIILIYLYLFQKRNLYVFVPFDFSFKYFDRIFVHFKFKIWIYLKLMNRVTMLLVKNRFTESCLSSSFYHYVTFIMNFFKVCQCTHLIGYFDYSYCITAFYYIG